MSESVWTEVDQYIAGTLVQADEALDAALAASEAAGLPAIAVSPAHGKLLHILARMIGAQRILEIGTLGGYSTIWLARALNAGGSVISLELLEKHAVVARENLARAGVADCVDVRVGSAIESLANIEATGQGPFDFTFIDADKANIPEYFRFARRLSRPGSVIVVDNVVRGGAIINDNSTDESVRGVRSFHDLVREDDDIAATAIQTVGVKGYDGFTIAIVD